MFIDINAYICIDSQIMVLNYHVSNTDINAHIITLYQGKNIVMGTR